MYDCVNINCIKSSDLTRNKELYQMIKAGFIRTFGLKTHLYEN